MSTYDFSIQSGASTQVSLPVNVSAYDSFRADFSSTRNFTSIIISKSALTTSGNNVMLALSTTDVDTIKDCQFRLIGAIGANEYIIWAGGIDYTPAKPATATVAPPTIRRFVHVFDVAPGRFGFDLPVTWDTPFPSAVYNVDCTLLDPTADSQSATTYIGTWTENGDGTGGTANILPGSPNLAIGQHIEVWGYV